MTKKTMRPESARAHQREPDAWLVETDELEDYAGLAASEEIGLVRSAYGRWRRGRSDPPPALFDTDSEE
jgi:hypothetical protein